MGLYSEIFRNLLVTKHLNYGYQFKSVLGVLCFNPIPKYCNVWYEGIFRISQWSDTGPSWPSCYCLICEHLKFRVLCNFLCNAYLEKRIVYTSSFLAGAVELSAEMRYNKIYINLSLVICLAKTGVFSNMSVDQCTVRTGFCASPINKIIPQNLRIYEPEV